MGSKLCSAAANGTEGTQRVKTLTAHQEPFGGKSTLNVIIPN